MKRILILNKIKHKPIIIEKIFPYAIDRSFIFLNLINNDYILKSCLKNSYRSLKKNNNLSKEINDIYYKFIFCRLLYDTNFKEYINIDFITKYIKENKLYNISLLNFYSHFFDYIFVKKNINKKFLIHHNISTKFIIDYLQYHKKIVLFIYIYREEDINFINIFKNIKDIEINLIIFWNKWIYNKNILYEINNNFKINKVLYSNILDMSYCESFYYFLLYVNKFNIKEIIFDESFSDSGNQYLEFLSYDINKNKVYDTLKSVDKIIYDEPDYLKDDGYKKIFVRYSIINFFSSKAWCNLVIIKPDDFNNIKNLKNEEIDILTHKINKFEEDENKEVESKILYIDFENNSPFQENFIYFWNKYLGYNDYFNTIYITNIGKINYSQIWFENIKNNKTLASYFSNLGNIYYINKDKLYGEKNQNVDDIKKFIYLFFYLENSSFLHEIYIDKELNYLYYTDELDISCIKGMKKNKNISIKIYNDNIEIGYEYTGTFKIKVNNNILEEKTIIEIYKIIEKISSRISKIKKFDINKEDLIKINLLNNYNSEILKKKEQYHSIFKRFNKIFYINKILLLRKDDNLKELMDIFEDYKTKKLLLLIETNDGYIFGACSNFNKKKHRESFVFDLTNDCFCFCLYGYFSDMIFGIYNYFHVSSDNTNLPILSSLCLKDLKLTIYGETSFKSVGTRKINKIEVYELVFSNFMNYFP